MKNTLFILFFLLSIACKAQIDSVSKAIPDTIFNKDKYGFCIGASFNPVSGNIGFPLYPYDSVSENAFIDFKVMPIVEAIYIMKNNFVHIARLSYETGDNTLNNVESGNKLDSKNFNYSLLYLLSPKIQNNYKVSPYAGINFYYSQKDLIYSTTYLEQLPGSYVQTLNKYRYNNDEKTKLYLFQIPAGLMLYSKSFMANLGLTFNIYGKDDGVFTSSSNDPHVYAEKIKYTNHLLIFGSMRDKYLLNSVSFRVGYLF